MTYKKSTNRIITLAVKTAIDITIKRIEKTLDENPDNFTQKEIIEICRKKINENLDILLEIKPLK